MPACSRLTGLMLAALLCTGSAAAEPARQAPQPPDQQWQPLFQQVQGAHLFKDQKTFADAIPRQDAHALLDHWQQAQIRQAAEQLGLNPGVCRFESCSGH